MRILNPGTSPVTYDRQSHVIAAGETLHDVQPDELTQACVERGFLTELPEDTDATPTTGQQDKAQVANPGAPAPEHDD